MRLSQHNLNQLLWPILGSLTCLITAGSVLSGCNSSTPVALQPPIAAVKSDPSELSLYYDGVDTSTAGSIDAAIAFAVSQGITDPGQINDFLLDVLGESETEINLDPLANTEFDGESPPGTVADAAILYTIAYQSEGIDHSDPETFSQHIEGYVSDLVGLSIQIIDPDQLPAPGSDPTPTPTPTPAPTATPTIPPTQAQPSSIELFNVINAYRVERGLPEIAFSPSLTQVAEAHVADLSAHYNSFADGCNLHSWSDTSSDWVGCCYTSDHAEAQCMWDKPREMTSYPGNGYEISAVGFNLTAESALELWKGSSGHHAVIINEGIWSEPWGAMGAANNGEFAVVWFGRESDPTPTSTPTPAPTATPTLSPTPAPTATPTFPPTPAPTPTPISDFAIQVVELTNIERANAGLPPLQINPTLTVVAQDHAVDMAENDYFDHTGLDGSQPWDRVSEAGYSWSAVGENIAAGSSTPAGVVAGWMNSPGHRANILNASYQEIGVGYYFLANDSGDVNYRHYWVQVFARP